MDQGAPRLPRAHDLLAGRSVLVTGAAGTGIGHATAVRCVEEGARVVVSGRDAHRLREAADRIEEACGRRPDAVPCDIRVESEVEHLFATVDADHGGLDVVVNNAAVGGMAPVAEMTDEQWGEVVDTSLTGTFRCTRAAVRRMLPRAEGVIVNIASVVGWRSPPGMAHYSAAKAGVMALTRSVAAEVAASNVRVNAVAPTIAAHEELARKMPPGAMEAVGAQQLLGRAARPEEIANLVVFLASDYSSYLTGEVISASAQHP